MSNTYPDTQQKQTGWRSATATGDLFARQAILTTGIILLIVLLSLFVWYVIHVFLLVFSGLLLAILLHIPTRWLRAHTPLPEQPALAMVILSIVGVLGLGGWFIAPEVVNQGDQLLALLPNGVEQVRQYLNQYSWTQQILDYIPPVDTILPSPTNILTRISGMFSGVIGLVTSVLIIFFIGLYLAFQPHLYINGVVVLFPHQQRSRVRTVLHSLGHALTWWLIGRLFAMVALGVFVGIGLWMLDVPLSLALGILTGLLSFVPIIGTILAALPPLLIALTHDPSVVIWVGVLYLGAQALESYLLTPTIQQKAVELPPVLAFVVQLVLGVLTGALGVALAYPLAIVGLVLVKRLYIEDVLGDSVCESS